ncbi:acetyl-CoA C-acetyltransferase [Natronoglycomyces albus]|uniref:Probable acetyl-CoA acetyltransferase n=1 Tax=Natronoglycomyces albus TaxID=2811108 RepID=A0A895XS12_9ACTN|nr:acetyl-CoA C-acetyltransferase [Natronoglycomyces albus]QSB05985.1 acetyl-CoA C-acetyltransferase [Natronoglycomyces albus]
MVTGDPDTTVILSSARTPIGRFNGSLASKAAPELAGHAIKAALERAGVSADSVSQVILGQVLPAGVGQNPARQAAVSAGIPMTIPALSVNKVCLSGLTAIGLADSLLRGGAAEVIVAGGMESMSRAPHLLPGSRTGHKYGDAALIDHLAYDGLTDAYDEISMGESTERHLAGTGISRADQDAFAAESHQRAAKAADKLASEIAPIEVPAGRKETKILDADEGIRADTTAEGLGKLRPAFAKDGTITAASASQISDGAAALVLTTKRYAEANGLSYVGEILSYATVAGPDNGLLHQPSNAINAALELSGHTVADLDVVEINEAFAAVALASAKDLGIDLDKVNPNGGAIALGHPIGASGARLPIALLTELVSRGGGLGAVALCGGGGQGDALIVRAGA